MKYDRSHPAPLSFLLCAIIEQLLNGRRVFFVVVGRVAHFSSTLAEEPNFTVAILVLLNIGILPNGVFPPVV